jgi:flavin reductase (DIM6/NTAB) family NADH-FMN oxidoreductase RutF
MALMKMGQNTLKKMVFGETLLPQEFTIGLKAPQTEIAVWLRGMGPDRDVTHRQSTACSAPFVICIAFDKDRLPSEEEARHLSLQFRELDGPRRVLGEIGLKRAAIEPVGSQLMFFEARSSANYCLSSARLGAHYLFHAYLAMGRANTSGMEMSFLERRAAMVSFIRPHPVSVGSIAGEAGGNIFTMNLMGELGDGRFAFGLKDSRRPAHLVERTGRLAISSVPFSQGQVAFRLAANHFKDSIAWDDLPFATRSSPAFGIPIPAFALRVREMEVEAMRRIGSHTFFVARILRDESFSQDEELHTIHGFYQAWRMRERSAELKTSVADDAVNKRGLKAI